MKLKTLFAAITLTLGAQSAQAHDYISQVAQARDSLVQARDMFQGIACRVTKTDVHNNMITCQFARAVDNSLTWLDEIKPGDSNAEAERKIRNAGDVLMSPDEETMQAIWKSQKVKLHKEDFAVALTLSTGVLAHLGLLFIDPEIKNEPVPTRELVAKTIREEQ